MDYMCNNLNKAGIQFKSVYSAELQRNHNSFYMANLWHLI